MTIYSVIGVDLAKSRFEICGIDDHGKMSLKKSIGRDQAAAFFANLPTTMIAVEACAGAHYWARRLREAGHDARIIPAQFVRPFVKANKNDAADAGAIAEAARRPEIRFVPIKDQAHLDLQSLHRVRDRLVGNRTALCNQMRAILVECGINAPKGISSLRDVARSLLTQDDALSPMCRVTVTDLLAELLETDERIDVNERRINGHAKKSDLCKRLQGVPGVGPITATAIEAAVVNPAEFKNGRNFAAWIGLVPRHEATGGKTRLMGISKRGDGKTDRLSRWSLEIKSRRGRNKAVVALANKNARIIWSLLMNKDAQFEANHAGIAS
jgi:transposase